MRPITNQSSFQLTLRAVSSNGLKENLEVNWLLLKREDMVEYILPPTQQINTIAYTGPLVQELQVCFEEAFDAITFLSLIKSTLLCPLAIVQRGLCTDS